jgi:hypothetical protein
MLKQLHIMKSLQVVLGFVVLMGILAVFLVEPIPPRALTRTRLDRLEYTIHLFVNDRHRLPTNLSELPERKGYDNSLLDAWGKPILYSYDSNGMVTLDSLESEKHPDGNGNHERIERHFATKDTNGQWLKGP